MRYLLILFSLLIATPMLAQDSYEIEVLIFEHQSNNFSNASDPERWPANVELFWPTPLLDLSSAKDRNSASIVELSPAAKRLDNESYAMRVTDGYRLLWHKAWRMPVLPEERSPWILVQAGEEIGEHYRLEGAIRVHLSRFLHIDSNLWLTEPLPPNSTEPTEFYSTQLPPLPTDQSDLSNQSSLDSVTGFYGADGYASIQREFPVKEIIHIQSSRRMRSTELHYIDHPKVGILTVIHPIAEAVEKEAAPIEYIPAPLPTIPNR